MSCAGDHAKAVYTICANVYKHINAHYSFLLICNYCSGLLMGIYLHWLVMITRTMIGVAYVYLSASLVIVGLLPTLDDWCCLPTIVAVIDGRLVLFTSSDLEHNSLEWHLTIASLCMQGATACGAVLCFCTVCTQIHRSRCDRSRYALLIGNENDWKLGHSDLSVTWIRSSLIRRFWICCN